MQNHSNEQFAGISDELYAGFEYAGFWVRLAAYVIDIVIVTAGLLIIRLVFLGINSLITDTFLGGNILFHYTLKDIVLYVFQVVYFILFTYHTGSTPGKRALNLKVIRSDSVEEIPLFTVIYRETIGRFLCGFIVCVGYLLVGIDKEKRGLHDILCDTRVIYAKKVRVYQERTVNQRTQITKDVEKSVDKEAETLSGNNMPEIYEEINEKFASEDNYVPRMIDEPLVEKKKIAQTKTSNFGQTIQDDIQAQWNRILNPEKETIPQKEKQNIEGNP